ncbi:MULTISPECIES: phosphatase PAP2 family protein [Halolamina]|uniref:PAP2 superfamily protein n=1 Tax=Halolamina pelagica TaxID=699431 RepID=A0A1I5MX96_9EURY|nr:MULTISPECIES: phosphatase PAP2 family protein [Halolamina]NHX36182.1 inositol phosphorylceramide synthase [Halolamina sp. R1-12]SFP13641.1 PAP2 superfamily protein [Halolamina pelagica]
MSLFTVLTDVVAVVLVLHLLSLGAVRRLTGRKFRRGSLRENVRAVGPTAVVLGVLLLANGAVRDVGVELSWLIGVNITGAIHAVEGTFVADLQSIASPELTAYFSFVYVFGYVFLLTFPIVLYALHDDARPLAATLVAYALNYGIGLVCYVLFVAYGPRNFMPGAVESLLFTNWPEVQHLTSQVNENTNVFPSLHTSLSVTVALLAARYRSAAPGWLPIATVGATSVAVATMYLGIHWLTDVLAGIVLAVFSVAVGARVAEGRHGDEPSATETDRRPAGGVIEQFRR